MVNLDDKIVIVGAGCFGVSTAYHLLQRGYADITILDRSTVLPAPDAASNDINKIVRSSYKDIFYAKLARDAIHLWRDKREWGDSYQQSGVLVLGLSSDKGSYADQSFNNDTALGATLQPLPNGSAIRAAFPLGVKTASFDEQAGYINHDGGWANASLGLSMMISKVVALNGKIFPGKCVSSLIREHSKTTGVQCADGTVYYASLVVLAVGSWTPSAFPELGLGGRCLATGQCVAMVELTKEEANIYKACPVVLDFSTGFYVFPPNEKGVIKMATHLAGYTHTVGTVSTPRTVTTDPDRGLLIPSVDLQELRRNLRAVYPSIAEKPFIGTRLCWYNDSPDGDWVIGYDNKDTSLMLATAGSGHAYKFLPVIGRLVADAVQGTLEPSLMSKFSPERQYDHSDASRWGQTTELDLEMLCTEADFFSPSS